MSGAFNSEMLIELEKYATTAGSYDENNIWVAGTKVKSTIWGIFKTGNKFSQHDEGISLHSTDGGDRLSNYKKLWVTDNYPVSMEDMIGFKGKYYNVLQQTEETVHGYNGYLIEESKERQP